MQIKVNPHTIQINKTIDINEGEYNIQQCQFSFSEEYTNLVKVALFGNETNTYQVNIENDTCIIPYEVLENNGTVLLGVYGYEADGETLIKRYSPKPEYFYVEKGSYTLAEGVTPPTPSVIEQLQEQITENANNISTLQDLVSDNTNAINEINNTIPTLATKEEIPTKTSELTNDSNFAYESDIPDVSNFITKEVDDLTNYTPTEDLSEVATTGDYEDLINTPDLSVYATTTALGNETINRENADIGLQGQIDAITSSSDVKDIVGTYQDLLNYDTQHLGNNDVIKVLQDSTHNDAMTYYRWIKDTSTWQYIGQEGPYYTKSEIDTTLTDYVTDTELSTTLQPYVKNTNYATGNIAGVFKTASSFNTSVSPTSGILYALSSTYAQYQNKDTGTFISKGTLENVITGKDLTTKAYVDGLVGDINTALDTINGEEVN